MTVDHKKRLKWIKNRVYKKAKIKPEVTEQVLGVLADLMWDWKGSKYDLYGLCLEETLQELGYEREKKDQP